MFKQIFVLLILLTSSSFAYKINSTCQANCNCDLSQNSLTILCNQPISNFLLPDQSADANIQYANTIIARNSLIQNLPSNLCNFKIYLNFLDLSENSINSNVTSLNFNCLTQLKVLNLSSNAIRFLEESSFDMTYSLRTIDLSMNRIQFLPTRLFAYKLPNLRYLNLQKNFLEILDPWYFTLAQLVNLNLNGNLISKFTNNLGYDIFNTTQAQPILSSLDLRSNRFFKFDDNVLKLFKVTFCLKARTILNWNYIHL